jgi:hypothetical protein
MVSPALIGGVFPLSICYQNSLRNARRGLSFLVHSKGLGRVLGQNREKMNTTELLTEPELTPILEAYFETRDAQNKALDACSWSMSLNRSWSYDHKLAETIAENVEKMTNRTAQLAEALILASRFADFVALGIDELENEYTTARYRYQQQQRDIADAPRRAWAMAYNARLAEIDSQIRGAKIRRGKLWTKLNAGKINGEQHGAMYKAISAEIDELEARREIAAADKFESVVA